LRNRARMRPKRFRNCFAVRVLAAKRTAANPSDGGGPLDKGECPSLQKENQS